MAARHMLFTPHQRAQALYKVLPLRVVDLNVAGHVVDCCVANHPGEDWRRAGRTPFGYSRAGIVAVAFAAALGEAEGISLAHSVSLSPLGIDCKCLLRLVPDHFVLPAMVISSGRVSLPASTSLNPSAL
jgi:hypothetical protein